MSQDRLKQKALDPNTSAEELNQIAGTNNQLARLVAINPNANGGLLARLFKTGDRETLRSVAANPNTPAKLLFTLAHRFPQEFFANPVVDLLPLENPDFIRGVPYFELLRLLQCPQIPLWFLTAASGRTDGRVLCAVASHPQATEEILSKLIATQNSSVCLQLALRDNLSSDLLRQLTKVKAKGYYSRELTKKIRLAILQHPNNDLDILQQLASDIEYTVRIAARCAIASHPQTNMATIKKLAFDAEPSVKKAVAYRQDLPIELVREMAKDRQIASKGFLLRNSYISSDLLGTLAEDSDLRVQHFVALHPNTDIDTLTKLADNPDVASFVLQSPNLTAKIFEQLLDNNPKLNLALAKHARTRARTLEQIAARSEDVETLIAVVENRKIALLVKNRILSKLAKFPSLSVRQYVAQHRNTPHNILWLWVTSQRYYKLHPFIAKNTNAPAMLLDYLARKFYSRKVGKSLQKNPNTSEATFEHLYSKKRRKILLNERKLVAIAAQNDIDKAIAQKLIIDNYYELRYFLNPLYIDKGRSLITKDTIFQIIKDCSRYDIYLIQKGNLPLETVEFLLKQIAKSYKVGKRKFAARHPKTPTSALEKLAEDSDYGVKEAAMFRLKRRQNSN